MPHAYETQKYRNIFAELGYSESEIEQKILESIQTFFYGTQEKCNYYLASEDMAYIVDTGNLDVRTEGMSYGMMICVQMDMKAEFDRLWRWTKRYMWMSEGKYKGYFAWSVGLDGVKNSDGPAPDGEEYFALALFFAGNRWGNGTGIFDYANEARMILHHCVHKGEDGIGEPMWNPENKLIKFVPNLEFSDPSYHLPHFYELFALWANEEDRDFWKEAADASRAYLKTACHPITGLAPEYAAYDGSPQKGYGHDKFYSDAYRVLANIGLDYEWFGNDEWFCDCVDRVQTFFGKTVAGKENWIYEIDGTRIDEPVLHPLGLLATNAMGSLASKGAYGEEFVKRFWEQPMRQGSRRYYDNCLYLFAILALSGRYKIYM